MNNHMQTYTNLHAHAYMHNNCGHRKTEERIRAHMNTNNEHAYILMYMHICMRLNVRMCVYCLHIYAQMHTCTHAHTHACSCNLVFQRYAKIGTIHVLTQMHIYIYTRMHIHVNLSSKGMPNLA